MSTEHLAPLQDTIRRANRTFEYLSVRQGRALVGWTVASELVKDPAGVRQLLEEAANLYQIDNQRVAASFLVMGYSWHLMTGALACFLLDQRVPDLAANAVAINLEVGVAFTSTRYYALPDDPAATHPDAALLNDRQELRAVLVRQLEEHHAIPLFETLRAVAPYGLNGMWANYFDRLASSILWLSEQLGDHDLARTEVPLFVGLASQKSRTGLIEVQHSGLSRPFILRGGCCLIYQLPEFEQCVTCSLRSLEERRKLLKEHLEGATG